MNETAQAALRSLPAWAGWSSLGLEVAAAIGLSLIATSAGAAVALRPLRAFDRARKSTDANASSSSPEASNDARSHPAVTDPGYAERARLAYPARAFTAYSALLVPSVLAFVAAFSGGGHLSRVPAGLVFALAWLAALIVALRARLRIEREARRIALPVGRWLKGAVTLWIITMPHLFVALAVTTAMPPELGLQALAWLLGGAAAIVYLLFGGTLHLLRLLRLARPASPRVMAIVEGVAARTGVRPRSVFELVLPWANAYAMPLSRRLGFTDEAVRELRDEELAAVCAHEIGHLTESRAAAVVRLFAIFALYVPIALMKPLLEGGNPGRLGYAMLGAYACLVLVRRFFRRMEVRADKAAHAHEGDEGTYARALARIHEVNASPVVLHKNAGVHPDLYDRLTASGAPPTYPRPEPPSRLRSLGALGVSVAVAVAGSLALHVGLRVAARWSDGPPDAASIALVSAIGDAQSIGHLGGAFEEQGQAEAAIALYQLAAEADDEALDLPARLAIAHARAGRCEDADHAVVDAHERMTFYGLTDEDGLVAEAQRAVLACIEQRDGADDP